MSRQPFDPRTMPLAGTRLIEASAGTGKTFSLAGLYLRLLVEQRAGVREILVITFTRAATKELRERIRKRLADAARIARHPETADPASAEDAFAEALIADSGEDREAVARRLAEAAHRMDEATITTIHGFSQRAAQENAFNSALPFDRGEQVSDNAVYEEVTEDYWRAHALGSGAVPGFVDWWPSPRDLHDELGPFRARPHAVLAGPDDGEIEAFAAEVKRQWTASGTAFAAELRACWDDGALKAQSLKKRIAAVGGIDAALSLLAARMGGGAAIPAPPEWVVHLQDAGTQFRKDQLGRGERLFDQELVRNLCRLQGLTRLAALRQAREAIRETASERKLERRQFSFDDMIQALHAAVTRPDTGPRLADALFETWPWALVDEFQDTDPLQYAILRRVYADRDTGALILIGDPKQAIYGFRGGDVYAYLEAAADAGERAYSLDTNFRSTQRLLDGVEALFRAPGDDAFLVDGIAFQTVKAGRGGDRTLRLGDGALAPLTLWHMAPGSTSKGDAQAACRAGCVDRIRALLDPDGGGTIHESHGGAPAGQAVAPQDIAVLVNTNAEAADLQRALSRAGIAAVCLHQQSVFASAEARDLLHVLKAAADPVDEGAIRGALAGELLGRRLGDLIAMADDVHRWQAEVERFQGSHERWRDDGVLAMLQPLIQQGAERLLGYEDGERRVSNYLQLAELLAETEGGTFGMAGLLRWLRQAVVEAGDNEVDDAEQLRLESDEALVRIATVHKAKGLEYPLVFLPYAPWVGAGGSPDTPPFRIHDADNRALVDVLGEEHNRGQSVIEQRAEALRLLYVAVTRAEIACFLPWGAANGTPDSPLASLLHRGDGIAPTAWGGNRSSKPLTDELTRNALGRLASRAPDAVAVEDLGAVAGGRRRLPTAAPPRGEARQDLPAPRTPWSVFSFTRLVRAVEPGPAESRAADETAPEATAEDEAAETLPELPGGTDFGTAVHALLETVDQADWPRPEQPVPDDRLRQVGDTLRRFGIPVPEGEAGETLVGRTTALICNAVHTPIEGMGPLSATPRIHRLPEMEFMLRLGGRRLGDMVRLLADAGYAGKLPHERQGQLLNGLMHGFIDLTVEHGGRFHVIDYKTNWLGQDPARYAPEALGAAVRHHHYDLQYLIYLTALHRYLGRRLPDYDPDRHLGGACYLFLRGMVPDAGQRGIFRDRPDTGLIRALDALLDDAEVPA